MPGLHRKLAWLCRPRTGSGELEQREGKGPEGKKALATKGLSCFQLEASNHKPLV